LIALYDGDNEKIFQHCEIILPIILKKAEEYAILYMWYVIYLWQKTAANYKLFKNKTDGRKI
jgi:hypothetical protein